ncbi:MAG: HPr family phosphocarrier protein [Lachnospiraceae bacterium]|nr:HPr family phosphocarrier protein [Lachnospiraceae bacterium]
MLGSVDKVKAFVNDMSKIEGDVFLCVGKYVIDAKSIMGIFSLELSKPLRLEIENWKEGYGAFIERYLHQ